MHTEKYFKWVKIYHIVPIYIPVLILGDKMINNIFDNLDIYGKGLTGVRLKSEVIADNIANVDTPRYKAKDISFENIFSEYLKRYQSIPERKQYLTESKFLLRERPGLEIQSNGNNVNIETEMISSVKNNLLYDVLVKSLNSRINLIKSAIKEGKR